ncbi:hypothetical protein AFM11_20485 [Mycolicibacterium wolinskyi]|uniref:Proline rich protein n=1 Tax=Mycolicibacterium wolinskyi TaxID=59750 RepID=A0A132PJP1_9MYCO|nr:hypothetical protein [Mycolicibacterium wolinskyi]KWX22523.1 hypothetical protein AFM11_20485 [Mycolicibacterium wolinskyi]
MTEPSDSNIEPRDGFTAARTQPNWLIQVAAWVGIIAGIVFVIIVVFFVGFYVAGYNTDRHSQWHHESGCIMGPGGMMGPGQPPASGTSNAPDLHHPQ